MKKYIVISWDFIGFHRWQQAPDEVSFLRDLHRHKFICSAKVQVFHNERDIEFFTLQNLLKSIEWLNQENDSCEAIAERILIFLQERYPNREIETSVSEDAENKAICTI